MNEHNDVELAGFDRPASAAMQASAMLDEAKAAQYLSVSPRTLQSWRGRGGGPKFVRISSRCIRYRLQDILVWQAERVRRSTSDPGPVAGAEVRP
jgi:predicted DNA-binding transcriptional regulator AlpA